MRTALLLIAHGSRQVEANADLFALAESVRERGEYAAVEACFLEIAEPGIETAAVACVEHGVERLILVPYFLSAGVHVGRDLEEYRRRLAERFTKVEVLLAKALGRHPLLLEVVMDRVREVEG